MSLYKGKFEVKNFFVDVPVLVQVQVPVVVQRDGTKEI